MTVTDAVSANLDKLRTMIAYDGTLDREVLVLQARTLIAASSEMLFEAGKRLLILKEMLPHGEFQKAIKDIGIDLRTSQQMMKATIKLGNSKAWTSTLLPKSKIFELALLDDDYLKELDENGTIAGVQLDEYDRMTTRELRSKVRDLNEKMRQKEESFERLLRAEQDVKQKLADDLHRLETAEPRHKWSEEAKEINKELQILSVELLQQIGRAFDLAKRVQELRESEFSTGQFSALASLQSLCGQVDEYNASLIEIVQGVVPDFKPGLMGKNIFDDDYAPHEKVSFNHPMSRTQDGNFEDLPGAES